VAEAIRINYSSGGLYMISVDIVFQIGHDWMSTLLPYMMWKVLYTACWKYRMQKKIAICMPSHNLSGYVFATKACIDTITPQPFYGPLSRTTRVNQCQKRTSGLYGARED